MTDIGPSNGPRQGFIGRHPWVALAAIGLYVAVLALGTVGELFRVQWILDLPIFKGP